MEAWLQDLRHAWRALVKNPAYTAVAAITLAVGIGANAAVFSVVDAVVLERLPFPEADELVVLWGTDTRTGTGRMTHSYPDLVDFRGRARSFDTVAAYTTYQPGLTGSERDPVRVDVTAVTHDFLPMLGVEPTLGRGIRPDEDVPGGERVVLLSHAFWLARFGGDPGVLGDRIVLDGAPTTIVGVLPPETYEGLQAGGVLPDPDTEAWVPMRRWSEARGVHQIVVIGRLAEGVGLERADADISAVAAQLAEEYPDSNAVRGVRLEPLHEALVGEVRSTLLLLMGAVGFVLLIACSNVANLALGRASGRRREVAIRVALGAGRTRLLRLFLTESVLTGAIGGGLGLLLAWIGVRGLVGLAPEGVPRLAAVGVDLRVLLFLLLVSTGTGVLFGLAPALRAARTDLQASLKEAGIGGAGVGGRRSRGALVVSQVALAVLLLAGAGLLIRSFLALQRVDPGFDPEELLVVDLSYPVGFVSEDWERSVRFYRELVDRVATLPGVVSTAAAMSHPFNSGWESSFAIEGRPPPPPGQAPEANFRPVTPGYFEAAGISLLRGRTFTEADDARAPGVVIVNEAFVREFFPDEDPLGKRIVKSHWWRARPPEFEIVGVVEDVKFAGLDFRGERVVGWSHWALYFPHAQQPAPVMSLLVRAERDPLSLVGAVRRQVWNLQPDMPVDRVRTMEAIISGSLGPRRFVMSLLGVFAAVSLLLAAVGLYGVLSHLVAQRRRELGIRMALGADRHRVLRMVLGQGVGLVAVGSVVGVTAALGLGRLLESLLFAVEPTDPLTYVGVVGFLMTVAVLASWIPARRATRVDPARVLREE